MVVCVVCVQVGTALRVPKALAAGHDQYDDIDKEIWRGTFTWDVSECTVAVPLGWQRDNTLRATQHV